MRAVFVLATVVLALALGAVAAGSESRLLIRTLIIGLVPAMWGVSDAIERLTGRAMWDFSTPYPYRWMRHHGATTMPRPNSSRKSVEVRHETADPSTAPLAA